MSDCNCNEGGYRELPSTNSWNENCTRASRVSTSFLLAVALLLISLKSPENTALPLRYAAILPLLYVIATVYQKPSTLLHIPSSIITANTRTEEFLDLDTYFPSYKVFEKHFPQLKQEVTQMLERTHYGKDLTLTRDTYSGENAYIGKDVRVSNGQATGWRVLNIKAGDTFSPYAKHFPTLRRILRDTKDVVACVVSVLEPGVTIPIHVGYYKGIMRYMIPTHVPKDREKVFLCVNGKKYNWTEGKSVLWDDNFPHKVYNYTDEIRVVIYMDILRPLTGWLDSFNKGMIRLASNSSLVKKEVQRTEKQVKL
jgi:beta-hydroxylase